MPSRRKDKLQQVMEFERGWIFLSRNRSSRVAEQFHRGASLEAVDRGAPNNLKNWQWTSEGDVSEPLTANHRRLRLQWAHGHRAWQAVWHQVVFSDESRFNLWDHDGRIRVRRYAGERCLLGGVIERHSGLTPGAMVWGQFRIMDDPICFELREVSIATGTSVKCSTTRSRSLPSRHP
ncbi:transposable element Tcb1 transposase [Trichonephila clavipes]|nr:transposable element Tcb1 transposase [Trichonephila clavipes]